MTEPASITQPTLPEVMLAVPMLLEPDVNVGRAPVAAALWVLAAGIPSGSPVWKHIGPADHDGAGGLHFSAMLPELRRFTDQWALVHIAHDLLTRSQLSTSRMWVYLDAAQQDAVIQALMIIKAGKNGEWPHLSDSIEAIFDTEPTPKGAWPHLSDSTEAILDAAPEIETELTILRRLMKHADHLTFPLDVSELGPEAHDLEDAYAVMLVKGPGGRWAIQRPGRAGGFWDPRTDGWESGSDIDWHGCDTLELAMLALPDAQAAQARAAKAFAERRAQRRRDAEAAAKP